ncbi:hypothetical protein F511_01329 [Dorcoceras hygrometricum]|uniref:A-kinase anchor protein 17A n=1 Tax=Dorcoceras hygrometricum TaxID=472368 RepID=A0A2Z7DBV3_9LAMI|nr:hypothetical protein F511_01329 [Dorcoceras hygrometricum]
MSHRKPLDRVRPTETFELDSGLSLLPRIKLNLTIHRADKSVYPIDEWKLKRSLSDYFKASHSISVAEEDIRIHKYKDLKKRKREEPVARGSIFILDFGSFSKGSSGGLSEENDAEDRFLEWRKGIVEQMDGMELNLEGAKFKLSVVLPLVDDFEGMKKEWEEVAAFAHSGYQMAEKQRPDTLILRGVPSRWFAEPRVSSKPSMLVTHTLLSAFGKIRNLDVAEDNDIAEDDVEDGEDLVSGLNCKIVVRFKGHTEFYNALKVFCGRSLIKQGSRLRVDYEVIWDKNGFFQNSRSQIEDRRWMPVTGSRNNRNQAYGHGSRAARIISDDSRRKRFKEIKNEE